MNLNGWDALVVFMVLCIFYTLAKQIIMGILTAKALKKAEHLGITKKEILDEASKLVRETGENLDKMVRKELLNMEEKLDKKYIRIVDPESDNALILEKASKKGTALHNEKIKVEEDRTVKAKSSNRTTKTKTTTVNKTTRKKKEEK